MTPSSLRKVSFMAEAFICRGGGGGNGLNYDPPIIADKHSILVTLKDSEGALVPNASINCQDGSSWYNYHTNSNGQCLFMTSSGQANVYAYNFSANQGYQYIDQDSPEMVTIDAPVGSGTSLNLAYTFVNQREYTSANSSFAAQLHDANSKIRVANSLNAILVAGGGGGGGGQSWVSAGRPSSGSMNFMWGGGGGGGGGITIVNEFDCTNRDATYSFYIGTGGSGGPGGSLGAGGAGGSTSGFGGVANGGGGGSKSGGSAGTGTYSGGKGGGGSIVGGDGGNSKFNLYSGGGAIGWTCETLGGLRKSGNAGKPGYPARGAGGNGGNGGSKGGSSAPGGSSGVAGCINISFFK